MGFFWGIFVGLLVATAAGVAIGVIAYRRFNRLQLRTRQAERLAELGTLTGGLAHEIKNPLSTVQLNLQLLREDLDPGWPGFTRVASRLTTVQKETARLRDILDDFLRYAGRMEIEPKPTDVFPMLEELVDFFAPQAQLQRVRLRMKRDDGPMTANIDARLIKQAILNLLINALQAMPETGGEIILSARREDGKVSIDVTDTGRGMSPELQSRIFDAYYSTKKGGTGLGLAISRRIVEEHGGKLVVSSEQGKGTVFSIIVPG